MPPALPNPPKAPRTIEELFAFYHDYVKLLYSAVQTENALPQEVLFELNAAFDHLSRHWIYGQPEDEVVSKCFGHLKRSCLDIFKIAVREARKQYDALRELDTSAIDNGDYDKSLHALFSEIRKGATEARRLEGDGKADSDGPIKAFDAWQPVYINCLILDTKFFHHQALDWANRRWWVKYWKSTLFTAVAAFIAGVAGREYGHEVITWLYRLIGVN